MIWPIPRKFLFIIDEFLFNIFFFFFLEISIIILNEIFQIHKKQKDVITAAQIFQNGIHCMNAEYTQNFDLP